MKLPIRPSDLLRKDGDGRYWVGRMRLSAPAQEDVKVTFSFAEMNRALGEAFVMGVNQKADHARDCIAEIGARVHEKGTSDPNDDYRSGT